MNSVKPPGGKRQRAVRAALAFVLGIFVWSNAHLPRSLPSDRADRIVVEKSKRLMTLYKQGRALAEYRVALGREPRGPKRVEGDRRTPEGNYKIVGRNPASAYHLALRIDYPSDADRKREARPGGDILVHGLPNALGFLGRLHRLADWTRGCIAVTNWEIDAIAEMVPDGTPIEIRP